MYFCNGIDNTFSWNGTLITEYTGANTYKGKYILLANDVGYIAGDPTVPTTLGYTGALPVSLATFPNALVLDQDDSSGKITGLNALGPLVIVSKERKIYQVDTATPSSQAIDYSDGSLSDRAMVRVENEVFFLNDKGVFTLAQREATIGSLRADSLTDDLTPLINEIYDKTITSAIYVNGLNNYYLFVDTNADTIADTVLVYSILTRSWTKYIGISANEAVVHEDIEDERALLIANALSGQMIQMEYGTNDRGTEIIVETETKTQDFKLPEEYKTFHYYDYFGFINEGGSLTFSSTLGQTTVTADAIILGTTYADSGIVSSQVLGGSLLGGSELGGGESTIDLYPFVIRVPLYQTENNISMFTKWDVSMDTMPRDFFPINYIA
jgi:hypothetical protein